MRKRLRTTVAAGVLGGALVFTGCSTGGDQDQATPSTTSHHEGHGSSSDSGGMEHPMDGGPAPEGIETAASPTYPVGTEVTLTADHMEGMDGANATIAGAYDTYTYAVDFTPSTGGEPVKDHKWVVQQEIKDAGDERLADGTEVTLEAEHMEGMEGAEATIASSTEETVYMVDYESDGMTMTNHKWVVESEIKPAS
ncbi:MULTISPECIES: YdhK family protein [Micrococcus]|uniref:YdhK family protein n=1 Tax=Micrococcus TaxID=1269 RepID=UPI0010AE5D1F|nr:YdhK family protein [Micrococcus luteus]MBN6767585.1 YdhK family protein [Micrococcus luteus]MBN6828002.1 YdhK family protein [Micrococcus luteus]MBN6846145.1 YdhK family protein [Micrococcus luteus]MBN6862397.1 YdhK family protein [Micrococcus luteus]MBN6864243.1 YdhK family protein [Micrococcus luteus]